MVNRGAKSVLLTGSSGFLGGEIAEILERHGYNIRGLSRKSADIICDLSKELPALKEDYELVIHAAGLAHVEASEIDFYGVNVVGTQNLLLGLESSKKPKSFIYISSVAVYGLDTGELIDENQECNPKTPYGMSKYISEELIRNWCMRFGVTCTILRLPLVRGKTLVGNLLAMRNAISKGRYFRIGNGTAKKSWVRVSEVAQFIMTHSDYNGTINLTSNSHPTVAEIEDYIIEEYGLSKVRKIPYVVGWVISHTFGLWSNFPLSLKRFNKLTLDLTFRTRLDLRH